MKPKDGEEETNDWRQKRPFDRPSEERPVQLLQRSRRSRRSSVATMASSGARDDLDESSVTMVDVLEQQTAAEEDAHAVLGGSDDAECTYSRGYVRRQALYACLSCCPQGHPKAGVCLACSLTCHEKHDLVELYTKRDFRCDCGGPKFAGKPCSMGGLRSDENDLNKYNHNFAGLYCRCERPYPDPDRADDDDMIQCVVCEDWLHAGHLDARVPNHDRYSEMVCGSCAETNSFLKDYIGFAVNPDDEDSTLNETINVTALDDTLDSSAPMIQSVVFTNGDTDINETKDTPVSEDCIHTDLNVSNADKILGNDNENKQEKIESICSSSNADSPSIVTSSDSNVQEQNNEFDDVNVAKNIVSTDKEQETDLAHNEESCKVNENNEGKVETVENNALLNNLPSLEPCLGKENKIAISSNENVSKEDSTNIENSITILTTENDKENCPISDIDVLTTTVAQNVACVESGKPNMNIDEDVPAENDASVDHVKSSMNIDEDILAQNLSDDNLNEIFSDEMNELKNGTLNVVSLKMLENHNDICQLENAINAAQTFPSEDTQKNNSLNVFSNNVNSANLNSNIGNLKEAIDSAMSVCEPNVLERNETIDSAMSVCEPNVLERNETIDSTMSVGEPVVSERNEKIDSTMSVGEPIVLERNENIENVPSSTSTEDEEARSNDQNLLESTESISAIALEPMEVDNVNNFGIIDEFSSQSADANVLNTKDIPMKNTESANTEKINVEDIAMKNTESANVEKINIENIAMKNTESADANKINKEDIAMKNTESADANKINKEDIAMKDTKSADANKINKEDIAMKDTKSTDENNINIKDIPVVEKEYVNTNVKIFNKSNDQSTNGNQNNGELNHSNDLKENNVNDASLKRKIECDFIKAEPIDDVTSSKKQKMDFAKCIRPMHTSLNVQKGAIFWPCDWRTKLCTCLTCTEMYKEKNVTFLLDTEDTVIAYENLGKTKTSTSQYEKGLQALSSLDRIQQINAITEYNKMKEKLVEFLKTFKDKREIVREEDIKGFFAGMKPKREPDGVYFCR